MHPLCHGLRKDTPSPGTIQARRMRKQSGSEHPQHIRHAMHGTNKGYAGITLVQEGPEGYTPTVHDIGKRLRVAPPSRNVLSLASAMLTYGVSRPGRRDSGPCNSRTKIKTCVPNLGYLLSICLQGARRVCLVPSAGYRQCL